MNRQANASAKSKELQLTTQCQSFAAHLLLPNRTQAYPPPDLRTGDNLKGIFDRLAI